MNCVQAGYSRITDEELGNYNGNAGLSTTKYEILAFFLKYFGEVTYYKEGVRK
jgi:hypothetical protein